MEGIEVGVKVPLQSNLTSAHVKRGPSPCAVGRNICSCFGVLRLPMAVGTSAHSDDGESTSLPSLRAVPRIMPADFIRILFTTLLM